MPVTNENDQSKNFEIGHPAVRSSITVKVLALKVSQYTVMGRVTATGKYAPYASGNSDGTEEPRCIICNEIDTTTIEKNVKAYFHGEFDKSLVVGSDANAVSKLRDRGIFLKEVI